MADSKPGYPPVPGDGGRASGLIRRRTAEEERGSGSGSGSGNGSGFLDLSLGSIYNSPSSAADGGFSPVARALLPAAAATSLDASSGVPSVLAAATAAYAPPVPDSRASAFALGLVASEVPGDGNGGVGGHVLVRASKALAAANPASLLTPLFASDGSGAVPVHGNAMHASDRGATPVPGSKGAVALLDDASPPSSVPLLPPNTKSPRGRRGSATGRRRRSGAADAADAASEGAPPPFPWATEIAGVHPTLAELMERGISFVEGEVRCKRCDAGKTISYEIRAKFEELSRFIVHNVEAMHDRAPPEWMYPSLPDCDKCGQKNSLRPVIAAEKWRINWIFLLLGQTLGLCTLEQLKHFCARTKQHRTGAKDRVLYSTYMELCNQLCPGVPFDMASERKNRTRPFA